MKLHRLVAVAAIISTQLPAASASADNESQDIKALLRRIEELDQKVKILERNRELDREAAETKAKAAPNITIGDKGFAFSSADGNFALKLRGVLQADSRTFFADHGIAANDGFLLRRLRPIIEGTVFRDFDFLFMTDFGGGTAAGASAPVVQDAYLNYRHQPELQLRVGKFKTPFGLELLQSNRDTWFNERALPTTLVPNRDLGVQLHGEVFDGRLNYQAGLFNGVGDNRNSLNADTDDSKEFVGRVILQPFKKSGPPALQGFGFGLAGSYQNDHPAAANTANSLGNFPTDGQQQYFAYNPTGGATVVANGEHWRLSPQGYYFNGPFGLFGEYVISNQRVSRAGAAPLISRRLENTAWQISAAWILTGEEATYKSLVPAKPFSFSDGGWGAWQLAARYAQLDIDNAAFPNFANPATSASGARAWSLGLNWFLNRNVLVKASFSRTTFDGDGGAGAAAPAAVTRQPENVLFTRVQLAF